MTPRQRTMIILPICLLLFNAVEEVVEYKLPRFVPNPYYRTLVLIFLFTAGFAIIGDLVVPWVAGMFDHGHKKSQSQGGKAGVALFYVGAFALVYFVYFIIYIKGPQYILPPFWR